MFSNPTIAEALASQHRRDMIAQAEAYRLARTARQGHRRRPAFARGPALLAWGLTAAAAAVFAVFLMSPAGPANADAGHWWFAHYSLATTPSHFVAQSTASRSVVSSPGSFSW